MSEYDLAYWGLITFNVLAVLVLVHIWFFDHDTDTTT
jgi:hypothetical protein